MPLEVKSLTDVFAATVGGIDLVNLDDQMFKQIQQAFEEHGVLIFQGQPMDDAQQVAFSERFGPLERTVSASPTGGTAFARQSNIDIKSGDIIAKNDIDY